MTVDEAYAEVERVTRKRARNFAYGIMVLPRPKRRAVAAIYAFAREVDDVADGDAPLEEKRRRLEELHTCLDALPGDEAMWVALADARRRYPIPEHALHGLVDGGLMDLARDRYGDFAELREYCRLVAGAVGVACVAVYGGGTAACPRKRTSGGGAGEPGGSPATNDHLAATLGLALQLINIIRDVREDWELGRVYLPQDELGRFGVAEDDIAAGRATPQFRRLMAFQAARARRHLSEGLTLLERLDARSAACVATFAGLYRATLDRIEASGFDVFDGPPRLSPLTKLRIVGAGFIR